MSEEDCLVNESAEQTRTFVISPKAERSRKHKKYKNIDDDEGEDDESRSPLLGRRRFQPLKTRFGSFRNSFRKLNCFTRREDEAIPMTDVPRHRSIDIGVGLARKMSLFLFTRKTVSVHPYHPYTPEQTTRKLYFCFENKDKHHQIKNNHNNRT